MNKVIEINNLIKKYDKFKLGSVNLDIFEGQIVGLIGENGAGKTTLIKAILNIIKIDDGNIKIFNKDFLNEKLKEDIAVVLDNTFFPELLTPNDIIKIMKNVYTSWDDDLFLNYLKDFDLVLTTSIKNLSKGMRKKLEIATALAHHPKLLICDEPTSGLDPVIRSEVLDIFAQFVSDGKHTILLSSHITTDLEQIADQIVFIDQGQIIINDTCKGIIDNYGILEINCDEFDIINNEDIVSYKKNKNNYQILINNKKKLSAKYKKYKIKNITLEELMVLIIKGEK